MDSVYKSEKHRNRARNHEESKIRAIAVYRMILENDKITSIQIKRNLHKKYGIICDRKTIYSDIAAVDRFIPIDVLHGKNGGFRKHNFEEDEL